VSELCSGTQKQSHQTSVDQALAPGERDSPMLSAFFLSDHMASASAGPLASLNPVPPFFSQTVFTILATSFKAASECPWNLKKSPSFSRYFRFDEPMKIQRVQPKKNENLYQIYSMRP
jgi:hypothetical protein